MLVDNLYTKNKKIFLQKHAFVRKKLYIILFKKKSFINLLKFSNYSKKIQTYYIHGQ